MGSEDRAYLQTNVVSLRLSTGRKLLFASIVVFLFLAFVETASRLFLPEPQDSPLYIYNPGAGPLLLQAPLAISDSYLLWKNRPGVDITDAGVRVRTNELGMRGGTVERKKPDGVFRILSLGESTSFGYAVEEQETYSHVLEQLLNENRSDESYSVLNAAVSGYSMVQSYEYLRRHGISFEPDVVLLYHGFNDFLPRQYVSKRVSDVSKVETLPTDFELLKKRSKLSFLTTSWLVEWSHASRWLLHVLGPPGPDAPIARRGDGVLRRMTAEEREEILGRIFELTERRGIKLIVLIPVYRDFHDHRGLLVEVSQRLGIDTLDLETVIERSRTSRKDLFLDEVHPTAKMHRFIGEEMCRYLRSRVLSSHER